MATKKARKSVKKGKRLTRTTKRAQERITLQRRMHGRGSLWG